MKKWIALLACVSCTFTSVVRGDEAEPPVDEVSGQIVPEEPQTPEKKQVGKAAADGTNSAKNSNVGKYVLAAGAVAIAVTAILLISRDHGRHAK